MPHRWSKVSMAGVTRELPEVSSCRVSRRLQASLLGHSTFCRSPLALAFKKLYPGEWFEGVAIPFVEDLVNQHPLDLYVRWRHQQGWTWRAAATPCWQPLQCGRR